MSTALIVAESEAKKLPRKRARLNKTPSMENADHPDARDMSQDTTPDIMHSGLRARPFDGESRQALIAESAYHRAAQRGFAPGGELDDWLAAEAEIDARLQGETHPF